MPHNYHDSWQKKRVLSPLGRVSFGWPLSGDLEHRPTPKAPIDRAGAVVPAVDGGSVKIPVVIEKQAGCRLPRRAHPSLEEVKYVFVPGRAIRTRRRQLESHATAIGCAIVFAGVTPEQRSPIQIAFSVENHRSNWGRAIAGSVIEPVDHSFSPRAPRLRSKLECRSTSRCSATRIRCAVEVSFRLEGQAALRIKAIVAPAKKMDHLFRPCAPPTGRRTYLESRPATNLTAIRVALVAAPQRCSVEVSLLVAHQAIVGRRTVAGPALKLMQQTKCPCPTGLGGRAQFENRVIRRSVKIANFVEYKTTHRIGAVRAALEMVEDSFSPRPSRRSGWCQLENFPVPSGIAVAGGSV